LASGDDEADPSDFARKRVKIERLAGMVGSLSLGMWFKNDQARHQNSSEHVRTFAGGIGLTKRFQQSVTQLL